MTAGVKHFALYSMETGRFTSTGNFSRFDVADSYILPFYMSFVLGNASGSMCSYVSLSIDGGPMIPACASSFLLTELVREQWGHPDAVHTSDCGAVAYSAPRAAAPPAVVTSSSRAPTPTLTPHPHPTRTVKNKHYTANDTYSAAAALNGGMDLNSNTILPTQLELAIDLGFTNTTVLDASVSRTLAWRFRLGMLDPLEEQPEYMAFGAKDIGSAANVAAAAEGSAQGLVLVKRGALPLAAGKNIAVIGPLGVADHGLLGDYYADAVRRRCPHPESPQPSPHAEEAPHASRHPGSACPLLTPLALHRTAPPPQVCPGATGYANTAGFACVETIAAAVTRHNAGGSTATVAGVSVKGNTSAWGAALAAAAAADAVVLVLGTDQTVAGEGTDLTDTALPGVQSAFALAVAAAAAGKPLVLVLVSSFPLAFDELVDAMPAVVLAYTPGMRGADAVAAALFGANRWGRAVLTHYPRSYPASVALNDFGMVPSKVNPGRTYRYYDGSVGAATVTFGQGLSYNTLALGCDGGVVADGSVSVACNVTSTAGPDGDQVLHVYHRVGADVVALVAGAHPIPIRSLVAATRLAVPAGATRAAAFSLVASDALFLTTADGGRATYKGTHFLDVWDGAANNVTITIVVAATTADSGLLPRARVVKPPF